MALYSYSRTMPGLRKRIGSALSLVLIFAGLTMLTMVIYPILTFELYYANKYSILASPVSEESSDAPNNISKVLGATFTDYTKASLWYPKAAPVIVRPNLAEYSLSIPKLKINHAAVTINGDDLSKSLIQYTGSLPGNIGNPVIFGHSTLLLFYNPKEYKRDLVVVNARKDVALLVFPTGARIKDKSGILEGNYTDGRRMITFKNLAEVKAKTKDLKQVIKLWLEGVE